MHFTFRHIETVDSTNAYLQRLEGTTEINGFVVSADEQTAGKGMGSNCWESAKGQNLTFSLALDTSWLPAPDQFMLSQLVPIGILEVLDKYLPSEKLSIKWPNDIYYGGHKLGGILINSTISGTHLGHSIIGIGLNINQTKFKDWPTHPISMQMVAGRPFDLRLLLGKTVSHIAILVEQIQRHMIEKGINDTRESLNNRYYARLYRYHEWADYEASGERLHLFLTSIDQFGRLQLVDGTHKLHCFDIKEIRFLP